MSNNLGYTNNILNSMFSKYAFYLHQRWNQVSREILNRAAREGAITSEHHFKIQAGISFGPVALDLIELYNKD